MSSKLVDLDEDELEHHFMREGLAFPTINVQGHQMFDSNANHPIPDEQREEILAAVEQKFSEIFDILRIDRNDPNSADTPYRLSRMLVNELFAGRYTPLPRITVFPNRKKVDELVISKHIKVMSLCSHHWQPISGHCAIGYVPRDKVIGLSKFTRIVEWYSRRGQIQEELGEQIADCIEKLLDPIAVGVVVSAKHYCMIARGVEAHEDSVMVTSVMRGELAKNSTLRAEFLTLIG